MALIRYTSCLTGITVSGQGHSQQPEQHRTELCLPVASLLHHPVMSVEMMPYPCSSLSFDHSI